MSRELEGSQKQKSPKLSRFNEPREAVKPNFFAHAVQVKNINNVVVKNKSLIKGFFNALNSII